MTTRTVLGYTEEDDNGTGYPSEMSWSYTGSLIASPHKFGVRVMAVNEENRGQQLIVRSFVATVELCNCLGEKSTRRT